jgi:transcriptional regulator with XRE-family HTH domain
MDNQLRQWRIDRNITQEKAADILGIGPRHIQRIEAGTRRLTPTLERLMQAI